MSSQSTILGMSTTAFLLASTYGFSSHAKGHGLLSPLVRLIYQAAPNCHFERCATITLPSGEVKATWECRNPCDPVNQGPGPCKAKDQAEPNGNVTTSCSCDGHNLIGNCTLRRSILREGDPGIVVMCSGTCPPATPLCAGRARGEGVPGLSMTTCIYCSCNP